MDAESLVLHVVIVVYTDYALACKHVFLCVLHLIFGAATAKVQAPSHDGNQ